ncbi:MAG: GNAT family N-acetyltransferase [Chloroflexi bacterium]|nr:GNAT family N-acetyltransferase [Chloroflexota bacterium]
MLGRRQIGGKISLVPQLPEHIRTIHGWYGYPDFLQMSQGVTYRRYLEWYNQWANNESSVVWSIVTNEVQDDGRHMPGAGGELIGATSLSQCKRGRWCRHSYIFIVPPERGKGYGTEAVRLRAAYAFSVRDVDALQTAVGINHAAIHRVLEKVGYRWLGRAHWVGHEQDMYVLRREWLSLQQNNTS